MDKTTRQQQAQETKSKLVEAALQLFSEKGVKESTVKDIAKAAGVTDGLIYHYFSSKEELLWTVMETYTINHSLQEVLLQIDTTQSLEQQLQFYFESMFVSLHKYEPFLVMCFGEAQRNPKIGEFVGNVTHQGVYKLIKHVSKQVNIDAYSLQIAAQNLQISMFMYFLMQDRFEKDSEQRARYIKESVHQFVHVIRGHR